MAKFAAFLRGVNVGGHTVKMDRLRRALEEAGLTDVATLIASGNVVFSTGARNEATLARKIEAQLRETFGFEVPTILRPAADVRAMAGAVHFPGVPEGGTEYVGFFATPVAAAGARAFLALADGRNRLAVRGRDVHWWTANKMMDSGLDYVALERALGQRGTFRNITTVRRVAEMLG